ncbi:putative carboxylesterase 2 [Morus notabilis]|uniref:Putative carboxylesterase 2 n=1 Tax=Morus notabilis TaxID=981085 RepID=W9QXL6_9ROSA|nr:probable carboxylesterase 2 [Morus notabilis]EXB50019.1 putative carboxylesterase 2 [Morus notabilis]
MGSTKSAEVSIDAFPFLRLYKDGTIERLAGTQVTPPGLDPQTGVVSKDVVVVPETGVSARLYRPDTENLDRNQKLPLAVYFHGGGFFISSTADPVYHNGLNRLVAAARIAVVSVDYRLAPENPLPAAYDDCWAALRWLASDSAAAEPWLKDDVDLDRVFLLGDSAGASIAHHMVCRLSGSDSDPSHGLKIAGIGLIHPYFWGEDLVGLEAGDPVRRTMVDRWWKVVCPSEKGNDDPLINPFAEGAPSLEGLKACGKILVLVAGEDILRDRGKLYYEKVKESTWEGTIEIEETQGEDHIFHLLKPESEKAESLIKRLAAFVKQG